MVHTHKVWLEIKRSAVQKNIRAFRNIIGKSVQLWAVVKSNAYGHGLVLFSALADEYEVDGFCVDSVVEGLKLRKNGILKPILVLGYTLPSLYTKAALNNITITISSIESLHVLIRSEAQPKFHIKIDTGMHRQGFYLTELPLVLDILTKNSKLKTKNVLQGIYTHFAAAKDCEDKAFTTQQAGEFEKACRLFKEHGCKDIICHAAATGGTLLGKEFHYDAVRIGIGLYGLWPSEELERQLSEKIIVQPALSWHSVISELKTIAQGDGIGYDITERAEKEMQLAIVPIGYWHGLPRSASSVGFVTVHGKHARIVGRVSMDMAAIDVTDIPCRVGDAVTIEPVVLARVLNASVYEIITRINPLIHKKIT